MTENETKGWLEYIRNMDLPYDRAKNSRKTACDIAIQALEEIQSYRAIGTVEDVSEIFSLCKTLQDVVKKYSEVGTIEEFKALKEKAEPKKIVYQVGKNGLKHEKCPSCGSFHVFGRYCSECGQKLDWGKGE